MADRWFRVPVVTNPSWDSTADRAPKYEDESGITRATGNVVTISGTDYYAVRFYGTTSALDTVEGYSDATSLQESGLSKSDIETELNERTGHSYSFSEWEQRFLTS